MWNEKQNFQKLLEKLQKHLDLAIYYDLIERHEIKNPVVLKYMILSLLRHVGKSFTLNKLYHELKSRGFQTGKDFLHHYAKHIEDAYIAFPVGLFDRSIRKTQTNPKKIYAIDPGLVRASTFDYESDLGRLFKNVMYLDLQRLKSNVHYYLTKEGHEIDFLAQTTRGEKKLFQVVWDMHNPQTMEREQKVLQAGMKELNIDGELVTLESYLQHGIQL